MAYCNNLTDYSLFLVEPLNGKEKEQQNLLCESVVSAKFITFEEKNLGNMVFQDSSRGDLFLK